MSSVAHRSVMSLPLLFLLAGVAVGSDGLGLVEIGHDADLVRQVAEIALFVVLFSVGMRVLATEEQRSWRPPVRALLIGMPVTAALITLAVWGLTDFGFTAAALVGVVLAPTDPVLVSGLLRRYEMPPGLRHTLNVESGVNDGLALPGVVVLIAILGGDEAPTGWLIAVELGGGVVLGAVGAAVLALAVRLPRADLSTPWPSLVPVALAGGLYGTAHLLRLNQFLAAFVGGVVLTALAPRLCRTYEPVGESASELVKFFALLVFGILLEPGMVTALSIGAFLVMVVALFIARPAALFLSQFGTNLSGRERLVAAWFGPKGLASVLYGLYVLQSGVPRAQDIFAVVALVVVASVLLHTTSDVPVARLRREDGRPTGRLVVRRPQGARGFHVRLMGRPRGATSKRRSVEWSDT